MAAVNRRLAGLLPQGRLAEVDGSFTHPPGPAKSGLRLRS